MRYFLVISFFFSVTCSAQSIFKRLPKPDKAQLTKGVSLPVTISAWRLTGPIAGYMYPQDLIITGLGFGYQRLHWVDSTQRYYTNFSISAVVYAGGNVIPSINPNNIISVGLSLGVLNQLIMVGPAWNFPNGSIKGSVGVVFNVSMPLN